MNLRDFVNAKQFVRQVARETTGKFPVLTVYVHTSHGKVQALLHDLRFQSKEAAEGELYANAVLYFQNLEPTHEKTCAAMFYKPEEEILVRDLVLPYEKEWKTETIVDDEPYLERLMELVERDNPYMVIMAENDVANVQLWAYKTSILKKKIKSPIRGKHKAGGWSQKRFQGVIKEEIHGHLKKVSEAAEKIYRQYKPEHIILVGPGEAKILLEKILHKDLKRKIIGLVTTTPNLEKEKDKIYNELVTLHTAKDKELVNGLITEAKKGKNAALGFEEIRKRAGIGEIETLYLDEHYSHDRSQLEHVVDDIEEFGGNVRFLFAQNLLDKYDGVVARLRFK